MEQEMEVIRTTEHPHIVRHLELLEDDVNFYIVSELVRGGELYDHILQVKRFNERQTARVIRQILLALNFMHKRDIVHRDIKPENILISIDEEGDTINVKLTDFGFACIHDKDVGLKTVLGTPHYMAPELVKRHKYGPGVDIWAVGVITHTLLTGCAPFERKT